MSPLVVTVKALRRAADHEPEGVERDMHHSDTDRVERLLWRERIKTTELVTLSLVRQATDVEFGLWALKVAETRDGDDKTAPDRYGRVMAAKLMWSALTWLDAAHRTDHEVTHAHLQDMINDVGDGKVEKNHYRWIRWLELLERLADTAGRDWAGSALIAAVWCGQSIVAPAPVKPGGKRYPTPRTLERLGRHCAHAAYNNLMWAWVACHGGHRVAHEIADIGAIGWGVRNAEMDARLADYEGELRCAADESLKHITAAAWNDIMEIKL